MMNTRYLSQSYDVGPVVIPAFSSLTHEHADQIATTVRASAPDWEVDRMDDCNGDLFVLVSMQDEKQGQPSYHVSGIVQQIELSEFRDEMLRQPERFDTLQQAINALCVLLKSHSGQ